MLPCVHGCAPASADRRILRSGPTLRAHSTSSPNRRPFLAIAIHSSKGDLSTFSANAKHWENAFELGALPIAGSCPDCQVAGVDTLYVYDSSCSWCPLKRGHHQTGGMQHNGPFAGTLRWQLQSSTQSVLGSSAQYRCR